MLNLSSLKSFTRNNQAEYEALRAGMYLAQEMDAENLRARSDSQLVTSQITGEYQTKDTQIAKYLVKVKTLASSIKFFEAIFVPQEQNAREDLLAKLASTNKPVNNRTVIQEVIYEPSTKAMNVNMISEEEEGWMTPLIKYLTRAFVPKNEDEEALLRRRASKFRMVARKLHIMGKATNMLRCL